MRGIILVVTGLLWSASAVGLNFKATTRADHKSLDVVVRRLTAASKQISEGQALTDVVTSLYHLEPMLTRHGGPLHSSKLDTGSEAEAAHICTQNGYANTAVNRGEIFEDIRDGWRRWIMKRIWSFLAGLVPWTPLIVWLWMNRRKIKRMLNGEAAKVKERDEEQRRTHEIIESLFTNKRERAEKFDDPLVARAHQRIKREI